MVLVTCLLALTLSAPACNQDAQADQLIDQLVNVGKQMAGADSVAWSSQFMAIDEEPKFRGGLLGSPKPTVDPTMRKLVQMGVKALPALIAHLRDDRKTAITIKDDGGMGAMWFADEYSPRYSEQSRQPKDVNKIKIDMKLMVNEYTIRVGDLCFVAIGQIVNRGLSALRYQPTMCEVINSPVHTPALATAVESDWSGLTEADHIKQLEEDAYGIWPYDAPEASKRMFYYYPAEGEKLTVKLLNRELYDEDAVWTFASERMMKTEGTSAWKKLRALAERKFGTEAAALIPHFIYWDNWETSTDHPKKLQERASRLLETTYPRYVKGQPVFEKAADLDTQGDLVDGLAALKSKQVDQAVNDLFLRALKAYGLSVKNEDPTPQWQFELDDLSIACGSRMVGKGVAAPYLRYFKKRLKAIGSAREGEPEWYRAVKMKKCIKLLQHS